MSIKIEMSLLNTPLLIILILLIILLIFCFMQHYLYKSQSLVYDETDLKYKPTSHTKHFNDKINKIDELKNIEIRKNIIILQNLIKETRINLQEKFTDVSVEELQSNLDILNVLDDNIKDFETNDLLSIEKTMNLIKSQRIDNKKKIVDLLTNIYILGTVDTINKGNAVSYREYLKYVNPKDNVFYKQYL